MFGDSDRSLPASRRRREQARQDGYIVQSRVLTTGLLLMLLATSWNMMGGELLQSLASYFAHTLGEWSVSRIDSPRESGIQPVQTVLTDAALWGVVLLLGTSIAISVQTRGWFAPQFVLPRASRVSPLANLRRLSASVGSGLLKSAISVAICGLICWLSWRRVQASMIYADSSTAAVARVWSDAIAAMTFQIGLLCIAYGIVDLFLRYRWREVRLRMTPAEWAQEQRSAARRAT